MNIFKINSEAIQSLRDEIGKNVHQMTYRAGSSAETAAGMARAVGNSIFTYFIYHKKCKPFAHLHLKPFVYMKLPTNNM